MGNKKHLSKEYKRYIASSKWYYKRMDALEFHGKKCKACGSVQKLDVHHLTYDRLGNEFLSDLIILCRPCHDEEHSKYKVNSTPILPKLPKFKDGKKINRFIQARKDQKEAAKARLLAIKNKLLQMS